MKKWIGILFVPLLLMGQNPEEIARSAESRLRSFKTLRAEFKQIYYSANVSTPLEEHGRVWLKKPGWMKWEYQDPEKKIYILKDELYQEYLPDEKLLTEQVFSPEDGGAEVLEILSGRRGLLENYQVELSPFPTDEKNRLQIKLTPLIGEGDTWLLLEIDERSRLIRKLTSFDWAGNRQEYHFSEIKTDIRISDEEFELKLPPDVEIIR